MAGKANKLSVQKAMSNKCDFSKLSLSGSGFFFCRQIRYKYSYGTRPLTLGLKKRWKLLRHSTSFSKQAMHKGNVSVAYYELQLAGGLHLQVGQLEKISLCLLRMV